MSKRGARRNKRHAQPTQAMNARNNRNSSDENSAPPNPLIAAPTTLQATISSNENRNTTKNEGSNSEASPNDRLLVEYTRSLRNWTVGLVLVGLLTAGVLSLQWGTFEKTDQTLKAEQRPWVSLQGMDVVSDLIWRPDGAHLDIHFVLKNTGHTPAIRAFTHSKAFVMFGREPNPQTAHNKFCEEVRKNVVGDAIFPGDTVIQPQGLLFERADVDTAMRTAPVKLLSAMILICVNYRFLDDSSVHQTTYIFTLQRKPYTDKEGRKSIAINPDDTVPATEITFGRFIVGFDAN
jgi:hypothetical protein